MWFVLLTCVGTVHGQLWTDPVDTSQGRIRGLLADDGDYSMYLGIPYAKVDHTDPFGIASPYPKFESIFDAYNGTVACPQASSDLFPADTELQYTLDCLQLDIYVPNDDNSRNNLSVLVFIHGGAFVAGSKRIGAKFLIEHDVIVISINYRLGLYGFMCLDTPEIPGNMGLKDQYLALEWIKAHIGAFGGDANKITIMGESAGSMSVDLHLLSKRPKNFNRAIMQSGSALCPEEFRNANRSLPLAVAAKLGFATENLEESLEFLSKTNVNLAANATADLTKYFKPCVEMQFENIEPFMIEHPENVNVSDTNNISILSGYNSFEYFDFFIKSKEYFLSLNMIEDFIHGFFNFNGDNEMVDLVRNFYIGDDEFGEDKKWELINLASDFKFSYPAQRRLLKYLEDNARTIYLYVFAYCGYRNLQDGKVIDGVASHEDELNYLFSNKNLPEPSEADRLTIERITTLWTNFAKYGEPTPELTDLLPVKWSPIKKNALNYINIDTELKLGLRPYHDRTTFWELFYKHNGDKINTLN